MRVSPPPEPWRVRLTRAGDALLAAVLAPACVTCEAVLDRPTAGPMCEGCWSRVRVLAPPWCDRCGHPLPTQSASGFDHARHCLVCQEWPAGLLTRVRAVGAYDGLLRELIHALKYGGRRSLATRLATLLRAAGTEVLAGADAVVPVPLHRGRRWERGFNQAELLARGLGPPVWRVLRRIRATPPQAALYGGARQRNVAGAFRAGLVARLRRQAGGARVVLVDDVATTGETLLACAAALREAGAVEVRALVAARTVLEQAAVRGARADR